MKNSQYSLSAHALGRLLTAGVAAAGLYTAILPSAHAASLYWDGSDTAAWETLGNWSTDSALTTAASAAPTSADVVFVGTTSSLLNYPVISTGTQAASELWLGAFSGNPSQLDITGGTFTISTKFYIAPDATSIATLNQSSGTVAFSSAANSLNIATGAGTSASGTYNMSGGTLSSATWFNIGSSGTGTGTFNLSGGTVNAATSTGAVNIGDQGGVTGALNVSGGTFNSTNTTTNGGIVVGNHWTGSGTNNATLTVSGSGVVNAGATVTGNGLKLASGASSVGTVNLNGGTIMTSRVQKGSGTGTFNFNGGTLQATAANTTYMTGLTNAFVKSGGAVIDTNGFAITIGQALLTDATSLGGGLTKNGVGTLTLSGTNTYTGATTVNAGTLATGATGTFGAGNVDVAASAALTFGNNASIGDLSTLTFASTSSIALSFTGAETLGAVYNSITATYLAAGTYDATGLNSYFGGISAFSGTGSLTVSAIPEPATYAAIFGVLTLAGTVAHRRRKALQA